LIISASRRTDLPAFYTPWFIQRIEEGFCRWQNPFNPKQTKFVSLRPEDVTAFVFWSKNPKPLLPYLPLLDRYGYRYYFQYTLNSYPLFEPLLPELSERLAVFRKLSQQLGAERVVWRYDPIIISSATPFQHHLSTFDQLASSLEGAAGRVVISFFDYYPKLKLRFAALEQTSGIKLQDPFSTPQQLREFCQNLAEIAVKYGMEIFSCCEDLPEECGIQPGACIDEALLAAMGVDAMLPKDKGQRKNCLCRISTDLGAYNTCRHNCLYCYANGSPKAVERRISCHDPADPYFCRIK